jgi:hypothetical protein
MLKRVSSTNSNPVHKRDESRLEARTLVVDGFNEISTFDERDDWAGVVRPVVCLCVRRRSLRAVLVRGRSAQ